MSGITAAPTLTTLVNFPFDEDGGNTLVENAAGDLFGASNNSASPYGNIFEVPKIAGSYATTPSILFTFNGADGSGPNHALLADEAGDIFGATQSGGTDNDGTVFELVNKGTAGYTLTTLVNFTGADGYDPIGGLIADASGDLFGVTERATDSLGTLYEIPKTPSGYASTPITLATFHGADGELPTWGLIADAAGDLFGITGGEVATVFELVKTATGFASTPTTLVTFSSGVTPNGNLVMDPAGDLFGVASGGYGSVFEIQKTASGYASAAITLVNFERFNPFVAEGEDPWGGLSIDDAGNLFGTTEYGGAGVLPEEQGFGTVFEIPKTADGYADAPTTIVSFGEEKAGYFPQGGLLVDASGNFFDTTESSLFELSNAGFQLPPSNLTQVAALAYNGYDGIGPHDGFYIDSAGDLFDTAEWGGSTDDTPTTENPNPGDGTVFEITHTNGTYATTPTQLAAFDGTDGANPITGVTSDAKGDLFGTTSTGGQYGYGTSYELVNNGTSNYTLQILSNFTTATVSTSVLASDAAGDLFGIIYPTVGNFEIFEDINNGGGTYAMSIIGTISDPNYFLNPNGGLAVDAQGDVFGTTAARVGVGTTGGTVFELVHSNGGFTFETLASNFIEGANPADLVVDAAGDIFGATSFVSVYGTYTDATIFRISKNDGTYDTSATTVANFDPGTFGNNIIVPQGLTPDASGDLFGLTRGGYTEGTGSVFELTDVGFQTACYCRGTLIRTDHGDVAVEDLRIGDCLITATGMARPIIWIGQRTYAPRFVTGNRDVLPVLIRAGALAAGVPARDLRVSPLHALYLDGVLIPAVCLVNGLSIIQPDTAETIAYFHVELETHDVILAEGAPAESFLDDDSRGMFHNAAEFAALYPGAVRATQHFCAPRVEDGEELEAVRIRLAARCGVAPLSPVLRLRQGHFEAAGRERVIGWAWDGPGQGGPVALRILDNGQVIGRVLANRYRRDLEIAGIGDGRHGFEHVIPGGLSPFVDHNIQVQYEDDGCDLPGSSRSVAAIAGFDEAAEAGIAQIIERLPPGPDLRRALAFLTAQLDRLTQRHADATCQRADRLAHQQFRRRWGSEAGPCARVLARRALMIDCRAPLGTRDAGSQVVLSHLRALRDLGYDVSFVAADMSCRQPDYDADIHGAVTFCGAPYYASVEDVLRRQANCFDLVYLHRAEIADRYLSLARAYAPRARLLYNVADLHHVRLARQANIEARPELLAASRRVHVVEQLAAGSADAVLTHSQSEAQALARMVPPTRVHVVPWEIPPCEPPRDVMGRHGVAFIGGYGHSPNQDGAYWLVEAVMPLVWRNDPELTCWLIGSEMPERVSRLASARVKVVGEVEDLSREVFNHVRLTVAPLRYGAGIKGKVLTSFAAGVPCVMSEIAAEGLMLPAALQELVGRDAAALAKLIYHFHNNKSANLAAAESGRSFVRQRFTHEATVSALQTAISGKIPVAAAAQGLVLA